MEFGRRETADQTDAQYEFLAERLDRIEEDWEALHNMHAKRGEILAQNVEAHVSFF